MFGTNEFLNSYSALKDQLTDPSQPRAYLNYVLLDEQMQIVPDQSGVLQVNDANRDNWATLTMPSDIMVARNGYLLVYMSNQSRTPVFLDDLRLTYSRGKLLEEQHYYPHGLVIQDGKNSTLVNRYL